MSEPADPMTNPQLNRHPGAATPWAGDEENPLAGLAGEYTPGDFPDLNPDTAPADNRRRAALAAVGANAFYEAGFGNSTEEPTTILTDLYGDLFHLCDALGLDANGLIENGRWHYECELEGRL